MTDYLEFVKAGVQTLIDRQSACLGGQSNGVLCITVTKRSSRTYRSLGGRRGDTFYTYLMKEQPMEMEPYRLDLGVWPVLELLSDVTGDPGYRQMVIDMATEFGRHGFDPASGLGYLGAQAEFDVVRLKPVPVTSYDEPTFKPSSHLPLEMLWAQAPEQLARMVKSAYYGLVTRPEDMDYNRFCPYGFDDSNKKPAQAFHSQHVAFAQTGAMLIHWWGFLFAHTGDLECLSWAQAMADKWQAVQHPKSGLIPHWFGSDEPDQLTMPPRPYANSGETMTGISLLWAARELAKRPEGSALAGQVTDLAVRLLRGMGRHGYDPEDRFFPAWLNLDGTVREETTWYCFRTQAQKDEAAKRDPILQEISVYAGAGLYSAGPWAMGVGCPIPYDLALGASLVGDPELLARGKGIASDIVEEAARLTAELNESGQWMFPASASYIKMMLLLFRETQEQLYLDWAQKLADMELGFLAQSVPSGRPEWWRMPFRNDLLEAMLLLHQEGRTA